MQNFLNFDLKFIFQGKFFTSYCKFYILYTNTFFDVLQMSLVTKIPLFGIILQILNPEDEKIEYSKNISQDPLNDTSACTKHIVFKIQKLELHIF